MLYIRRIFFDNNTGDILHAYMMQGDICPGTAEEDAQRQGLTDYGVLEWDTPDPEIEAQFVDVYNNHITVDVAADPPALVFGHVDVPEPPAPEDETADMQAALALLGVEPGEEVPDGQVG